MKTLLIIPFYNEEKYLKKNFESLINQTYQPQKIIYVNDNSTDNSIRILNELVNKRNTEVSIVNNKSSNLRMPGKKVINAFNFGLKSENLDNYDLIGKFIIYDANLCISFIY
jgi:cellulose synthase/poly-beta-1,6-N-acetylglucosamine synthase-like glycosyltransferase